MDFIKSNILLIGLLLGSGVMLLIPNFKKGVGGVSPAEAVTLINRSNAFVLDVRGEAEFAGGHIADATNIPIEELVNRLAELKKYQNKQILVNCQKGTRSLKASDILRKAQFTQIDNLHGGLDAWIEAKLPIVTKATFKKTKRNATNDDAE